MKTVRLGKTDLEVSRVGIGGIPLMRPPEAEAIRVVQRALDLGVTFVDTALGYRDSEIRVGKALSGRREQVVIATKGGGQDKATALGHIDLSLERLNTDYIDLWQFHNVSSFEKYERVVGLGGGLEGALQALQAGKVRYIGLSSHSLDVALEAVRSGLFETIQFPFNYVSDEAVEELLPLAEAHDVGFIGMKPFAGGQLGDANLSIKYVLQFPWVVPDPGVEKVKEIEEIVGIVESDAWKLSPQEGQEIEQRRAELGTRFCRQCEYCLPCPQEVYIPMIMIVRGMWALWPQELFRDPEWWFSKAVMSGKNCVECGECEAKCPYNLPIREMIVENIAFYERVAAGHSA
jgi:predicted aldo/keto reductase-like oxidoreductase